MPTMQELQQLYESKQWQPLLQKVSKVLPLRGQAAAPYDRYELFMMKGEAHLNLKQAPAASSAFDEASKLKDLEKTKMAVADAMVLLIKRSSGLVYKRKSPTTQPGDEKAIDLVDRDKRKAAFAALAADEQLALQPKVKAATSGNSLRPIADMLKSLDDLKTAEMASTDSTDTPLTAALVAPLAKHAKDLTAKEVSGMKSTVDAIERSANTVVDVPGSGRYDRTGRTGGVSGGPGAVRGDGTVVTERRYKKRGLIGNDTQNLKDVIQTCENIDQANKHLAEVFTADLAQPLLDTARDATALAERAKTILNTDFSITSNDPRGFK
jgi:hypothetical protein